MRPWPSSGAAQQRLRKLPARVVVYLLLAAALFEECGYPAVWARLTAALGSLPVPKITATGLWHARARLGVRPLRALFNLLRGPAIRDPYHRGPLGRAAGRRGRRHLPRRPGRPGHPGPAGQGLQPVRCLRLPADLLVALVACGTRAVIDAVFGPRSSGETTHGKRLARPCNTGMIVLLDRGFSSNAFLATVAGTGAAFLARLSATRKPPVLRRFDDGSFLSRIGQLEVRIIECEITIATTAGPHHRRLPAGHHPARPPPLSGIRAGQALSRAVGSGIRLLRDQEIHARPTRPARPDHGRDRPGGLRPADAPTKLIRTAIADASRAVPGADPDRASFSIALQTARDQVVQAAGVIADTVIDLVGTIGRAVLNNQCPPAACASAPAPSNARYPDTHTRACASTGTPTRPPSASTSS